MKMPKRTRAVAVVAAGLMLTACGAGSGGSTTTSDGLSEVQVGVTPIANAAPLYLGIEQGFFEEVGLKVEPKTIQAASSTIPSLLNNQQQFAMVSAVPTITGVSKGIKIQTVTGNDRYSDDPDAPDGAALIASDGSGITKASELAGSTIAIVGLKSAPELAVRRALKASDVDPSTVKFVEIAYPDMVPALRSDRVDAALVVDPFLAEARAAGLELVMQPFAEGLPGKVGTTWIAASSLIESDAHVVDRFARAMDKSIEYAADHPDAVREVLGTYTKLPPKARNSAILPHFDSHLSDDDLQFYADTMVDEGFIADDLDASGVLWKP